LSFPFWFFKQKGVFLVCVRRLCAFVFAKRKRVPRDVVSTTPETYRFIFNQLGCFVVRVKVCTYRSFQNLFDVFHQSLYGVSPSPQRRRGASRALVKRPRLACVRLDGTLGQSDELQIQRLGDFREVRGHGVQRGDRGVRGRSAFFRRRADTAWVCRPPRLAI